MWNIPRWKYIVGNGENEDEPRYLPPTMCIIYIRKQGSWYYYEIPSTGSHIIPFSIWSFS
ncbi:hypothetical protein LSH36_412g02053 [Paralvinella palmiformis]|uniref:Uncharacterized protein n=1 Tax=Paralvinella palmiformis TaxID=53620 RepID=A0AAD9MYB7_9ANNE|nr:hypothetical protein LSH36_412g02053 [Paralvinella palmiformis]